MKTCLNTIFLTLIGLFASASIVLGGGNTSIVHLSEVHSVKIEPRKITIVGSGYVEFRVMTDLETATSNVFGQRAQQVRAKTSRGTFEIIPYFSDPEINGVPTGGHAAEELRQLSEKWWVEMQAAYASIRVGDVVTIGYQEDRTTLSEFQVQKITGAGSVSVDLKHDRAEQDADGNPHSPSVSDDPS